MRGSPGRRGSVTLPAVRRPRTITLVLLGAGAVGAAWYAWPTRRDECAAARAAQDKFADEICARAASGSSSGGGSSSRSSFWSSHGGSSSSSSSTSSSSRGGFGGSASSFSGGG